MNIIEIPIAIPTKIPNINPISKLELEVSFDLVTSSLSKIALVELLGSEDSVEFSIFTTIDFDERIFSELEITLDERFVNFALSVIGSVVEFAPNNVECVSNVYVPV